MAKGKRLNVRMTEEEISDLGALALKAGLSISDFVRSKVFGLMVKKKKSVSTPPSRRIGGSLADQWRGIDGRHGEENRPDLGPQGLEGEVGETSRGDRGCQGPDPTRPSQDGPGGDSGDGRGPGGETGISLEGVTHALAQEVVEEAPGQGQSRNLVGPGDLDAGPCDAGTPSEAAVLPSVVDGEESQAIAHRPISLEELTKDTPKDPWEESYDQIMAMVSLPETLQPMTCHNLGCSPGFPCTECLEKAQNCGSSEEGK